MYISAIKVANARNGVNQNTSKNKMSYSAMTMSKTSKGDSVSFGTIDPMSFLLNQVVGKIFRYGLNEIKIENAEKLIREGNLAEGIGMTVQLNKAYKYDLMSIFSHIEDLNDFVASRLRGLSDSDDNQALKKGFVASAFLRKIKCRPESLFRAYYKDPTSEKIKSLFKSLNNQIYGQFKKDLMTDAVLERKIMIEDTDSLLEGVGDKSFRDKVKSVANSERAEFDSACSSSSDDSYYPPGGYL